MILPLIAAACFAPAGTGPLAIGVVTRQEPKISAESQKSIKPIASNGKSARIAKSSKITSLSDKEIEVLLSQASKRGDVKLQGGSISAGYELSATTFSPTRLPSWCTSATVDYISPSYIFAGSVGFDARIGEAATRGLDLHLSGVTSPMVMVEVHLDMDEGFAEGSRLIAPAPGGSSAVQVVHYGYDVVAAFLVEVRSGRTDLEVLVPDGHLVVHQLTLRPIG